tara:strand:+ start:44 stop:961 length:918 start_codon:yes stop_codon:yes gene_type:complete
MIKIIVLIIWFLFFNLNVASSLENKILLKVNNEIITTVDISNEINYLLAINKEIKKLEQEAIIEIAKNNLIQDKMKKIELLKNVNELKIKDDYLEFLIKNFYSNIGFSDFLKFNEHLNSHNVSINKIKEKITINTNWQQFIYAKYKKQIKIDRNKILYDLKNKKNKFYKLSEILFGLEKNETLNKKFNLIKKSINKNGFDNTALIFSLTDTSKKGGDLGWVNSNAISPIILKQISLLDIKEFTKPIVVPGGFLILKIEDYKEEEKKINIDKEVEKVVNRKINDQIVGFSNIYLNKLKKDVTVDEL